MCTGRLVVVVEGSIVQLYVMPKLLPLPEPTHCPTVASATEVAPPPVFAGEHEPDDGGDENAPTKELAHWYSVAAVIGPTGGVAK